jgi:hypothetical protein
VIEVLLKIVATVVFFLELLGRVGLHRLFLLLGKVFVLPDGIHLILKLVALVVLPIAEVLGVLGEVLDLLDLEDD